MKSFLSFLLCALIPLSYLPVVSNNLEEQEPQPSIIIEEAISSYQIFDENNNLLTEKDVVELGDIIIDKNFNEYEIITIDDINKTATAKFIKTLEKSKIRKNIVSEINNKISEKKIGLYSTHNDESYIIGDNTESIYGAGGIHDIGNLLKQKLEEKNIKTTHDETLHIPHNSSAYKRSRETAKKLLAENNSAIFDIHRDATSRSFYLTKQNGKNYSKVRIVVGQSNPNKNENLQFALWICSVAEQLYPWLIADIYYGKNCYNQDLSPKAILFEMGCHNIEKEFVKNTVPILAEVINTTLFNTTVEEESGNLNIGSTTPTTNNTTNATIDEFLDNNQHKNKNFFKIFLGVLILSSTIYFTYFLYKKNKKH